MLSMRSQIISTNRIYHTVLLILIFCITCIAYPDQIKCGKRFFPQKSVKSSTFVAGSSDRVLGGDIAEPYSWPWQASILRLGGHVCGGTLIDDQWVLTAAHCVAGRPFANLYAVNLGSHFRSKLEFGEKLLSVKKIRIHPLFRKLRARSHDIALLKLGTAVNSSDSLHITHVCLPTFVQPAGKECVVSGWGRTTETGTSTEQLREISLPIIPFYICNGAKHYFTLLDHTMFCAGTGGRDACQGDSGGPLVCKHPVLDKWEIHGVISWGVGCGRSRFPGVYSKVLVSKGWILAQIATQ